MARCPFSLERFVNVSPEGQVFYRTENAECRPFADENHEGEKSHPIKRNFQNFKHLDFIADLTPRPHAAAIEKILRHTGLWRDPQPRAPPPPPKEEPLPASTPPRLPRQRPSSPIPNPKSAIQNPNRSTTDLGAS
jgi:hypothetical protein